MPLEPQELDALVAYFKLLAEIEQSLEAGGEERVV